MSTEAKAFVLMSFQPEFKSIYEKLIKPTLEEVGYLVERADSILDRKNILKDIIERIAVADLIVADLTSVNPNVLYELGICHGLRVPTVMIAQSIDEVPFDLRGYRIVVYSKEFDEVEKFINELKSIAQGRINQTVSFESPITDHFAKMEISNNANDIKMSEALNSLDELEEEGFLDLW